MVTICTIGYTRKSLEGFIHLLRTAGVEAVIDVRLRNTSQLAGFTKRDDLAFLLREGFDLDYQHRPSLAPSAEILDAYRSSGDWPAYEQAFMSQLADRDSLAEGREVLSRYNCICLLCAEPTPEHCHRRLVAEWWAQRLPAVEVIHLI
jgi:uncharacterized protein (DUF488 family)